MACRSWQDIGASLRPSMIDLKPVPGEASGRESPYRQTIQMRTSTFLMVCATMMLVACVSSPAHEEMRQLVEANRWELVRWGDRTVPHGDNGEPVILEFKDGRASGHAGCNRYSAGVTFGPAVGELPVSPGVTTRMACEPRRMEFEAAFIRAFEASTRYHVEGERLLFESGAAAPLAFYRRPLER